MNPADEETAEISRIRAEYERRRREIPPDFYDWRHCANLFSHVETVRVCVRELATAALFPLA